MTEARELLGRLGMDWNHEDCRALIKNFTEEMEAARRQEASSLSVIPSYLDLKEDIYGEESVASVDAGGTNLRVARVDFGSDGKREIVSMKKYPMPGRDGAVSSDEFFDKIAGLITENVPGEGRIGISFAYKGEITPERDYIICGMCKEVEVTGISGKSLAKGIGDAFERAGLPRRPINTVNDTAASLIGSVSGKELENCCAAVGLVLGTGYNICYREQTGHIRGYLGGSGHDVVVTESGFFDKLPRTKADIFIDESSQLPGDHICEKMVAGRYLCDIYNYVAGMALKEGIIQDGSLIRPGEDASYVDSLCRYEGDDPDALAASEIARCIVKRSAYIVASSIAAVILSSREGDGEAIIVPEGSTILRMHGYMDIFREVLDLFLTEENGIRYRTVVREDCVIYGTASAAVM